MKNILVLTDFSANAAHAADCGLTVAIRLNADILLVNVYPITPYLPLVGLEDLRLIVPGEKRRESTASLNREVRRLEKNLPNNEVTGHRPVIRPIPLEGRLAECVSQLVRRRNSMLIIMGVSGRSYGDMIFDGDIRAVLQLVTRPVLVVPATQTVKAIRHILFATDLEAADELVIGELVGLCTRLNAVVSVSHVSRPVLVPDFVEESRTSAFIERITSLYPGIRCYPARGAPVLATLQKVSADKNVDVIALRYQKHSVFYHLFHGNPLKEAVEQATMPLLIFPETPHGHN